MGKAGCKKGNEKKGEMSTVKSKKMRLRFVSLFLAVALALGLMGCGSKETDTTVNTAVKDYVFQEKPVDLGNMALSDVRFACSMGDRIYLYGMYYGDSGTEELLISMDQDGSNVKSTTQELTNYGEGGGAVAMPEVEVSTEETEPSAEDDSTEEKSVPQDDSSAYTSTYVNAMTSDGTQLYFLVNEMYNDFENGVYEENYYLVAINTEGAELWRQKLGGNDSNSLSYFYINTILGTEKGVLCSCFQDSANVFQQYDANGTLTGEFAPEGVESGTLFVSHKGDIYLQYWTQVGETYQQVLCRLDLATETISEPISVPGMSSYSLSVCQYMLGGSYDLYLTDGMSVYGYNLGDAEKTKLLNYIDSDIDSSWMNFLLILSDTEFLSVGMDYQANDYRGALQVSRLTKVDPADVVEKTVLKLACYGGMYTLRQDVIAFNKENDTYRIQLEDYSLYAEGGDMTSAITRLNNDIIAGNAPDIMYLTTDLPIASYIRQGLFSDLYDFIDADPDMDREDFLTNIFEAFSVDGKLYQLVPYFTVRTVIGKTRYVGETSGWTVEQMLAALAKAPQGSEIFREMVRMDFLNQIMTMSGDQFVNWLDGSCHFDSEEFIQLLELCMQFPEEFDYSVYEDPDYWMSMESTFREDRTLLSMLYLSSYSQYQQMKYGTFGEDVTMVGFPGAQGNGAIINYEASWAITAKSKHADGAWSFVRQYVMPEYQEAGGYGWPIRVDTLEQLAQTAMEKPYYLDENGNRVEYDDVYWIGDKQITIPPMNQQEVDAVNQILTTVTEVANYNDDLYNIIYEEAQAYFSGQKSASEVANVIQSRAWVYVSENQ